MKIVYFDYASIFVIITLLVSLFLQKRIRGKANIAFIAVILIIFITSIVGVITLTLDNSGPGHVLAKKVCHFLYLLFHNYTGIVYVYYLMVLADTSFKIRKYPVKTLLLFLPTIVITFMMIFSLFTPILFYIDANDVYHRTDLIYVLYAVGIFNLCIGLFYLFNYKSLFNKKLFYSIFTLFPLIFGAMLFEMVFPNIVIEPFFNTLGLLFISYTIQRPEELIDSKTYFGNTISYTEYCSRMFINGKKVQQIFITITNYKILNNVVGYESEKSLAKCIADIINEINMNLKLHAELFYLNNGKFCVIVEENRFNKVTKFAEQVNNKLKMYVKVGMTNVNPIANVCIVKCPEDINNVDSLFIFCNEITSEKYFTGRILYAKNIYNPEYFEKLQKIDNLIEKALTNNNFEVYYQPIYSINKKKFTSAEALLRLKDPVYGFISPEIFIPAAEKSGAIHRIDNFVLNEVCKFISGEEFKKLGIEYVEVNLSVAHCIQDDITEQIIDILTRNNVEPKLVNLEVTETSIALSEEKLLANLEKLTKNNIKISLDDFGSGYSNIRRIAQLPISIVKIDKSLTDEIQNSRISNIFIKLNEILKDLDLHTVVEGVETKEVFEYFVEQKCDYIQGFYFSKPIPKNEFIHFIDSNNNKKNQ